MEKTLKEYHSEAVSAIENLKEVIDEKIVELQDQLEDDEENEDLQSEHDKYESISEWLSECEDHLTNTADELDLNND